MKKTIFYGYIIVLACFILQVVMFGPRASFGVFFKPLIVEFGWSRALLSGAFSLSALTTGILGIVMGGLNDRLGPKIVITLCGLLLGLGHILLSLLHAPWQLYLFYVALVGMGMGGTYVPIMSTIARWFVDRRNVMTGIVAAGAGIGGLLISPAVNWLIATYRWRTSFVILGVLILIIIVSFAQFLRRDPAKMGLEPYGKNKEGELRLDAVTSGLSLIEAAHTRQFRMTLTMLFCSGFCIWTIQVHLVPYLTDLGISAATAANILGVIGVGLVVGSIALGGIADKIGSRQAYLVILVLILTSLLGLWQSKEVWMFYLFAIIMGVSAGGSAPVTSSLVAELFGMRSHGLILGMITCASTIGTGVGPFLAGYIFDIRGSYQLAFVACVAANIISLVLMAVLRPIDRTFLLPNKNS